MRSQAQREIEIKLAVADLGSTARALRWLGFSVVARRCLEQDTLYDTPGSELRRRGCLLRLRRVGRRGWLTFKGPAAASRRYKIRPEWETELRFPDIVALFFPPFGLRPVFRYEKFRTNFTAQGRFRSGAALLDETPIGNFLELEGPARWIDRVARCLGARRTDYIIKSYAALYADWCRRRKRPVRNMVFAPAQLGRRKTAR